MDPAETPVELIETILLSLPLVSVCDLLQSSKPLFNTVNKAIHNESWWRERIARQVPGANYTGVHPALLSVNLEVDKESYTIGGFLDFYTFLSSHNLVTLNEWMVDPNSEATPEMIDRFTVDGTILGSHSARGEIVTFEHFASQLGLVTEEDKDYVRNSYMSYRYLLDFADDPDTTRQLLTLPDKFRQRFVEEAVKKVLVHPDFHPTPEVLAVYRELGYLDWLPRRRLVTDADYNEYLDAGYGVAINFLPNVFYYHVTQRILSILPLMELRIEEWNKAITITHSTDLSYIIQHFLYEGEDNEYVLAHPEWFEMADKNNLAHLGLDYVLTPNADPDIEELFRLNVGDEMEEIEAERMEDF